MAAPVTFAPGPLASAGGRVIASPFQFVITGEDNLRVVSANTFSSARVTIRARLLNEQSKIDPAEWVHIPAFDRSLVTDEYPLQPGAVLNLSVFVSAGTPQIGQTFVIVQLIRGTGAAAIVLGTMLAGYVTNAQHLGWPGSPIQQSTDGPGAVLGELLGPPAAGAEQSWTVPPGARRSIMTWTEQFQASGVPGNRNVSLTYFNGLATYLRSPYGQNIVAGNLLKFSWMPGYGTQIVSPNNIVGLSLPVDAQLFASYKVQTETAGMDPADQWGTAFISFREWLAVS